jgi:hypothetical protein
VAKRKKETDKYVRPSGTGPTNLNQHAPMFYDRRTKRNRDKASQDRNAINEGLRGYSNPGRGVSGESSN